MIAPLPNHENSDSRTSCALPASSKLSSNPAFSVMAAIVTCPKRRSFFFRPTARRLWRVQIYYFGALIFAATWMKHCLAIFNLVEPSFSGVWVVNTTPKVVDFPSSVWETLPAILRWRMVKFPEELYLCFEGNSMPFVDLAWHKGRPRILHPHPEIQMIHSLHWSSISVIGNTVESSRRMTEVVYATRSSTRRFQSVRLV